MSTTRLNKIVVEWAAQHFPDATRVEVRVATEYNDSDYDVRGAHAIVYKGDEMLAQTLDSMVNLSARMHEEYCTVPEPMSDDIVINLVAKDVKRCPTCRQVVK